MASTIKIVNVFLVLGILFSGAVYSDEFYLDLGVGFVVVQDEDYDEGGVLDHSIAYSNAGFVYRLGAFYAGELRPEDADRDDDTEIEIGAVYLGLSKELDLEAIKFELGAGAVFSNTEAEFLGREVADDDDTSPYVNVKVIRDLNDVISLQADWKYVDDLSGGDLHFFQAGVRFSF